MSSRTRAFARRYDVEQLEDRRLLVSRVFLDFGDNFPVPTNGDFANVSVLQGLTVGAVNAALVGGNGPGFNEEIPTGLFNTNLLLNPAQFNLVGAATISGLAAGDPNTALINEIAITNQIRRALEPFDIQVISSADTILQNPPNPWGPGTRNLANATTLLGRNNPAGDFHTPGAGTATVPQFGSNDVFVYIGGLFQVVMGNVVDMGTEFGGLLSINADFHVNVPSPFARPTFDDTGVIIDANFLAGQAAATVGGSPNVLIANAALYGIGYGFGLAEVEDGLLGPTTLNYQSTDTQLINQSSAMIESEFGQLPSAINAVSPTFFNRFNMMQDGMDFQLLLRQGVLGNPSSTNPPPFPYNPNDPNFFPPPDMTVNNDPNVRVNLYNILVNDPDIGRNPDVEWVSGTGAFDKITITKSGAATASVTVSAYRDAAFTSLIETQSYSINLAKTPVPGRLDDGQPFRVIVEGCNNDDEVFLDPRLGCQVNVHGGAGVTMLNLTGDGIMNLQYTPSATPTIFDDGITPAAMGTLRITGAFGTTTLIVDDFNTVDGSALRVDNFNKLSYVSPGYLDNAFTVTKGSPTGDVWNLSGQVVTLGAENGSLLMSNVKQLVFDTTLGPTNDTFTFNTGGTTASGLQSVNILGGTGTDSLNFDESSRLDDVTYTLSPTLVLPQQPGSSTFKGYFYSGIETLNVDGTSGSAHFVVTPSFTTAINVNGHSIAPDTSSLAVRLSGTTGAPNPPPAPPAGQYTFTSGHQPVTFTGIDDVIATQAADLVVSADAGAKPLVKVYDSETKALLYMFYAYGLNFRGGVRVATADLNGDGTQDVVVAPGMGPLSGGVIKVYDGQKLLNAANAQHFVASPDSAAVGALLQTYPPDAAAYRGGYYVAIGDVTGDGLPDLVVSRSRGASLIHVLPSFSPVPANQINIVNPYLPRFITGVQVAAADVDGDGVAEIITAPNTGQTAVVKIFAFNNLTNAFELKRQFNGFEPAFHNGVSLSAADLDGDGKAEIVLGAGTGGRSRVRVFNASLGTLDQEFQAFSATRVNAPLRIFAVDPDSAGLAQIYAAQSGRALTHEIRLFDPLSGAMVDSLIETNPDLVGGITLG